MVEIPAMMPSMEEILHQLIGRYPSIYKVLYIQGGSGFLNQQQYTAVWPLVGDQDVLAFFAQHDVVDRISDVQKAGWVGSS